MLAPPAPNTKKKRSLSMQASTRDRGGRNHKDEGSGFNEPYSHRASGLCFTSDAPAETVSFRAWLISLMPFVTPSRTTCRDQKMPSKDSRTVTTGLCLHFIRCQFDLTATLTVTARAEERPLAIIDWQSRLWPFLAVTCYMLTFAINGAIF